MASQIAAYEEDRKAYQEQLDVVVAGLSDDPDNAELKNLQAELQEMISLIDESLAELKPKQAPQPAAPVKAPTPTPPEPEKWSRENHPAFKKTTTTAAAAAAAAPAPPAEDEAAAAQATYNVNDTVLAKWVTGDKGFYPARITSITGSSTARVYIVKFKSYDTTETLRAKDIRPVSNKRKADGTPAAAAAAAAAAATASPAASSFAAAGSSASHNGIVTSASASIYPEQQARLDAEKLGGDAVAKPPKAKKIKANKELEKGKSKWQEFSSKSKFGKTQKKDSMFRTPEGVHGRGLAQGGRLRRLQAWPIVSPRVSPRHVELRSNILGHFHKDTGALARGLGHDGRLAPVGVVANGRMQRHVGEELDGVVAAHGLDAVVGAEDVGAAGAAGQGEREVRGHRRLADAALGRGHGYDLGHIADRAALGAFGPVRRRAAAGEALGEALGEGGCQLWWRGRRVEGQASAGSHQGVFMAEEAGRRLQEPWRGWSHGL
ncbi:hypothetical protein EV126DRAFT_459447 [Verticillium dahliae]|nr:hypothetical protein EV126DRAFT_459447 [Verticillium dahliae]